MKVYVETNFVLELTLEQEQHAECETILDLAEKARIGLSIPAFCFAEPFETMRRRRNEREDLKKKLERESRELRRMRPLPKNWPRTLSWGC